MNNFPDSSNGFDWNLVEAQKALRTYLLKMHLSQPFQLHITINYRNKTTIRAILRFVNEVHRRNDQETIGQQYTKPSNTDRRTFIMVFLEGNQKAINKTGKNHVHVLLKFSPQNDPNEIPREPKERVHNKNYAEMRELNGKDKKQAPSFIPCIETVDCPKTKFFLKMLESLSDNIESIHHQKISDLNPERLINYVTKEILNKIAYESMEILHLSERQLESSRNSKSPKG